MVPEKIEIFGILWPWAQIEEQSVDYAILEKIEHIACVKFCGSWSDLVDWNAVARHLGMITKETLFMEQLARLIAIIPRCGR